MSTTAALPPGTDARALMERIERPNDVREAAQAFEALFVEQLLAEMRRGVPEDGLFKKGFAEKTFEQMLDRTYAGLMASRGGVGLSAVLLRAWGAEGEAAGVDGAADDAAVETRTAADTADDGTGAPDPIAAPTDADEAGARVGGGR